MVHHWPKQKRLIGPTAGRDHCTRRAAYDSRHHLDSVLSVGCSPGRWQMPWRTDLLYRWGSERRIAENAAMDNISWTNFEHEVWPTNRLKMWRWIIPSWAYLKNGVWTTNRRKCVGEVPQVEPTFKMRSERRDVWNVKMNGIKLSLLSRWGLNDEMYEM